MAIAPAGALNDGALMSRAAESDYKI